MPIIDGKNVSPDEAILLGHCPECGQLLIPKTAVAHAASKHWFGRGPNDPWLSEEARRRYKLIIDFAAARYNPALEKRESHRQGNPMSIGVERDLPTNDKAVLGFCELWALFFGLPAGEALYRGEPFTGRMIVFVAIASVFAVIGPIWPSIKSRMPRRFAAHFVRAASDFRWWMIILLLGFVYLTMPTVGGYFRAPRSYGIEGYVGGGGPPTLPQPTVAATPPPETSLRLQFNATDTMPVMLSEENIWRWYAIETITEGVDPKKKTMTVASRTWAIFIAFDKPIPITQVVVNAGGAAIPRYEIKDFSDRTAVVSFLGDVTGAVLNITAMSK